MNAIALLSGGLDSTVNLKRALEESNVLLALTFDYGQRAAEREVEAARAIAEALGVPHRVVELPWLAQVTTTALVDREQALPEPSEGELSSRGAETAEAVWVPNRNGVFVNIAAAYAESLSCEEIVVGFNAEEGATFPDNSREFFHAANAALALSTLRRVRLQCYTLDMMKSELLAFGRRIDAPLGLIWPCYENGPEICWRCESCARLRRALVETDSLEWFTSQRRT